jgi:1,4-dihydroxy-2-naphthoate octaprenyltransferase
MLVDGVFTPKAILQFGVILLALGSLLGIYFLLNTGIDLLWIGLIGVLGTFFYYKMKFMALGDLLIFIIYGPLIALGTAFVMTNEISWDVLFLSIPIGFLVVNILHANNTRDIRDDGKANIKTQAMLLGLKGSKIQYILLAMGAYVAVILMVVFGMLHPLSLLVVITLPIALKNIKLMQQAQVDKPEIIKDLDAASAQLVMAFSVLLSLSNFIAYWL